MVFNPEVSIDTILALGMFVVAYITIKAQIKDAIGTKDDVFKARRVEQLKIAVSIEKQISETFLRLYEYSMEIGFSEGTNESSNLYITALIERYLYAIDMLCYAINKKYLDNEDDWKNKYNTMICCCMKDYERYYGAASPYKNTITTYKRWNPI